LIVSFFVPQSVWKITIWDSLCGVIALVGIGIWYFTSHPLVALVAEIIADVVAGLPTLWKSWRHPESEIWVSYLVGGSSAVLTILAIHHFTVSAWLFPAAIVAMNFLIVAGVVRGNRRATASHTPATAAEKLRRG
jgi:predicted dehydrogenase